MREPTRHDIDRAIYILRNMIDKLSAGAKLQLRSYLLASAENEPPPVSDILRAVAETNPQERPKPRRPPFVDRMGDQKSNR